MGSENSSSEASSPSHRTAVQRDVALCFKVPFQFRQWFKQQALSRELTMTEFLIRATLSYAQDDSQIGTGMLARPDLRK